MFIRPAKIADARPIAMVHIAAWKSAYAGLFSDEFLNSLSLEQREAQWVSNLSAVATETAVAEREGSIVGFVSFGPARDDDCDPSQVAEIEAIYVDPAAWGEGIGGRLFDHAMQSIAQRSFNAVTIWVLVANDRARRFYEGRGFALDGRTSQNTLGPAAQGGALSASHFSRFLAAESPLRYCFDMRNIVATQLLFDQHVPGKRGVMFPPADTTSVGPDDIIPATFLADTPPPLPEVSEPDVVRHFVNLSTLNMSVDSHFYPLGSCTMKYNPKRHERLSRLPGLGDVHPYQEESSIQGLLSILYEMQQMLAEIAGLPAVSLQPAAGAQGEFTALLVAAAYFRDRGEQRTRVLFPSSAHGTNPASAALAGFDCLQLPPSKNGFVNLEELKQKVDESTAVFMITNPNTLGLFEHQIDEISKILHDVGGLVYIDGANMNAICGITRPGDFGGDMMHYNVHKTFTGPHGAGGPGAGPIAVRDFLADYLPGPVVTRESGADGPCYRLSTPAKSIGRVRSFFGNVGILLRGYIYLRTLGPDGVRKMSEQAVLNANYLKHLLADVLPVPHGERCMHEFVASCKSIKEEKGITAMDLAKRLLDYGFHAPTVYFPLVVPEAVMIEPTETESLTTLEAFATAIRAILTEDPDHLKHAPHTTPISRPDEVTAGRNPVFRWKGAI